MSVPYDLRASLSIGLSVFVLLLGFVLAIYFLMAEWTDEIARGNEALLVRMMHTIPQLDHFTFHTGDESMKIIGDQFAKAKIALNTRIFNGDYNPRSNTGFEVWDRGLRRAVRNGLTYKEVVSRGNRELCISRANGAIGGKGTYDAVWINYTLPCFLNFVILEYEGGVKEVWFGWLVSRGVGFENYSIRTTEARIVHMFENWHRHLFAEGNDLHLQSDEQLEHIKK